MLVLTRKYQEKVRIGDGITITILRTKGKAVRLGIEAPADVPVIRGELAFDHPPIEAEVVTGPAEAASAPRLTSARTRVAIKTSGWSAGSHPLTSRDRDVSNAPQVSLTRVPRENGAQIIPQLVSSNGPLREMLNQRSATL